MLHQILLNLYILWFRATYRLTKKHSIKKTLMNLLVIQVQGNVNRLRQLGKEGGALRGLSSGELGDLMSSLGEHQIASLYYTVQLSEISPREKEYQTIREKAIIGNAKAGNYEIAEALISEMQQTHPQHNDIYDELLRVYHNAGKVSNIIKFLNKIKKDNFAWPIYSTEDLARKQDVAIGREFPPVLIVTFFGINQKRLSDTIFKNLGVPTCRVSVCGTGCEILVPGWLAVFSRGGAVSFSNSSPDEDFLYLLKKYGITKILVVFSGVRKTVESCLEGVFSDPSGLKSPEQSLLFDSLCLQNSAKGKTINNSELISETSDRYETWSDHWKNVSLAEKDMDIRIVSTTAINEIENAIVDFGIDPEYLNRSDQNPQNSVFIADL